MNHDHNLVILNIIIYQLTQIQSQSTEFIIINI